MCHTIYRSNSHWTFFLLSRKQECAKTKPGDIIVSPLSVASVLGLLSQAANGTTYDEIKRGLYLYPRKGEVADQYQKLYNSLDKNKGPATLSLVNQIYVQKGNELSPTFSEVAKDKYKAGIESLNFAKSEKSAKAINDFVQSKTNKKIMEVIKSSDLNSDTELVLLNAIYFKADWELKFNKSLTFKAPFHVNRNETVEAEFMTQKAKFFYGDAFQSSILEMKYAKSNISFVIVLPENNSNLANVENILTFEKLNQFLYNSVELIDVNVTIPKFGVEYEVDLKPVLEKVCAENVHWTHSLFLLNSLSQLTKTFSLIFCTRFCLSAIQLGMAQMFKQTRDLAGLLTKPKDLRVSKAIQKAVIEVNEDGSEATGLNYYINALTPSLSIL